MSITYAHVTKRFGHRVAVSDVSFEVRPGRITGLIGDTGSGKTVLLKILLGLARPSEGSTTILGCPYAALPRATHRVGWSIDGEGLLTHLSGEANLLLTARALRLPASRVHRLMADLGLSPVAKDPVAAYTRDHRLRLGVANALLAPPEALVLDDAFDTLDPATARWLADVLRSRAMHGGTVLVSGRPVPGLESVLDDVIAVHQTVRFAGPVGEFLSEAPSLRHRVAQVSMPQT